jgi:translation initiation factor IF-3
VILLNRLRTGLLTSRGESPRETIESMVRLLLRLSFVSSTLSVAGGLGIDKNIRVNHRIRAREVRVIDDNNEQLGVLTPQAALKIAEERGLDLVEVAATANPPVCRIMDYGKYLYQLNKKQHEAKKHQKNITVKEIKFRPNTDEHDYEFKKNHALRFLQQGDKVKASVFFRGREIVHQAIGRALLDRLIEELAEVGTVENRAKMEGPNLIAIISPKKA